MVHLAQKIHDALLQQAHQIIRNQYPTFSSLIVLDQFVNAGIAGTQRPDDSSGPSMSIG